MARLVCRNLQTIDDNNSSIDTGKACGITCNPLQNGFGRWADRLWRPYTGMYSTGRFLILKCSILNGLYSSIGQYLLIFFLIY